MIDRVRVVAGELSQPVDRRLADVVVVVSRQLLERLAILELAAARAAYMRSCQIREPVNCGSAAAPRARRGGGQRDERVRRAMPAARGCRVREIGRPCAPAPRPRPAPSRTRRADRARAARRACPDRRTAASAIAHASGVAAGRAGCEALRAARRANRLARRRSTPPRAASAVTVLAAPPAGAVARIASRRTCASGSLRRRAQHAIVDRRRR